MQQPWSEKAAFRKEERKADKLDRNRTEGTWGKGDYLKENPICKIET